MKAPLLEYRIGDAPGASYKLKLGDSFATFLARNPGVLDSDIGRALWDAVRLQSYGVAREAHRQSRPSFLDAKPHIPGEPRFPSSGRPTEFPMETAVALCRSCGKPAIAGADLCYSCE
jgi:hypothetical protein